jgi:hypothetical protein
MARAPQFTARVVDQLFGDASRLHDGTRRGFACESGLVVGVLCVCVSVRERG